MITSGRVAVARGAVFLRGAAAVATVQSVASPTKHTAVLLFASTSFRLQSAKRARNRGASDATWQVRWHPP